MLTLRDDDLYSWSLEQAAVLRRAAELRVNNLDGLDWDGVAGELEYIAIAIENEIFSRYAVLLCHLLKWRHQPNFRSSGWQGTINEQRRRIARLSRKNPGLRAKRQGEFDDAYESARARAAAETGLALEGFPATCPFTLDQVENDAFWPD